MGIEPKSAASVTLRSCYLGLRKLESSLEWKFHSDRNENSSSCDSGLGKNLAVSFPQPREVCGFLADNYRTTTLKQRD